MHYTVNFTGRDYEEVNGPLINVRVGIERSYPHPDDGYCIPIWNMWVRLRYEREWHKIKSNILYTEDTVPEYEFEDYEISGSLIRSGFDPREVDNMLDNLWERHKKTCKLNHPEPASITI